MRIFIITEKDTDLQSVASSVSSGARAAETMLAHVKALNPHVADLRTLKPGTVLVLPDAGVKAGTAKPATAPAIEELGTQISAALRSVDSRAGARLEMLNADHSAVRDSLKAAVAKRLVDSDPLLAKQLAAAEAWYKSELKSTTESRAQVAELAKAAQAEFARLQKMLG